jgi:hypothetical protein
VGVIGHRSGFAMLLFAQFSVEAHFFVEVGSELIATEEDLEAAEEFREPAHVNRPSQMETPKADPSLRSQGEQVRDDTERRFERLLPAKQAWPNKSGSPPRRSFDKLPHSDTNRQAV